MPLDYSTTMNAPKTEFPMRASLPQRESVMLAKWAKEHLLDRLMEYGADKPVYCLHDGLSCVGDDGNLGAALGKLLKDFVVRYKNMSGFRTILIPGWNTNTHSLHIEQTAMTEPQQNNSRADPLALRKHCAAAALRSVENQTALYRRLGTLADFEHPYLTQQANFEAKQVEMFGEMVEKGYISKCFKPVYWCPTCVTALAEAEIEYTQNACDAIYVRFAVTNDPRGVLSRMGAVRKKTHIVICTKAAWTLPANLAICLEPNLEYVIVRANGDCHLIAKERVETTLKAAEMNSYEVLGIAKGRELEGVCYRHPLLEREAPVIVDTCVEPNTGTGCVHMAPGHSTEDFAVCARYTEVGVAVLVDENGKMTAEAGEFLAGQTTAEAEHAILQRLQQTGSLFAVQRATNRIPHCWCCKKPVLIRACEQWICSVERLRQQATEQIETVQFVPETVKDSIITMMHSRNDWCISRQHCWGVPIPVFYCGECGAPIVNQETVRAVAVLFREEGADAWYARPTLEILPEGFACPHCGCEGNFAKETDTMDVWFGAGVSHLVALQGGWVGQQWPFDLCIEGAEHAWGWLQSSLFTALACKGAAPYKTIFFRGGVVNGSAGEMMAPLADGIELGAVIEQYGADIFRLWAASSDSQADIRISAEVLDQISRDYDCICRPVHFVLGHLDRFDPRTHAVPEMELLNIDRWALAKLDVLVSEVRQAYDRFEFHAVCRAVLYFCTADLSGFYLNVIEDRLHAEPRESFARRSAQTAIYRIARALTLLLAPILPFTAEEIWSHLPPDREYNGMAAMLNAMPDARHADYGQLFSWWDRLLSVRRDVNKALGTALETKAVDVPLEAGVQLFCGDDLYRFLAPVSNDLATLFAVSQVELLRGKCGQVPGETNGLSVTVAAAAGVRCERCGIIYRSEENPGKSDALCSRCKKALS